MAKGVWGALLPVYAYQIILRHPQRSDVRVAIQRISSENLFSVRRVLREDPLLHVFRDWYFIGMEKAEVRAPAAQPVHHEPIIDRELPSGSLVDVLI